MTTPDMKPDEPRNSRSLDEIIDGMSTPTDTMSAFTLFLALEGKAMEEGRSTPWESMDKLRAVFNPDQE